MLDVLANMAYWTSLIYLVLVLFVLWRFACILQWQLFAMKAMSHTENGADGII